MIVLGVIRIRAAHQRTQVVTVEERQEMEWDNSALNIIVNPMEQEGAMVTTTGFIMTCFGSIQIGRANVKSLVSLLSKNQNAARPKWRLW